MMNRVCEYCAETDPKPCTNSDHIKLDGLIGDIMAMGKPDYVHNRAPETSDQMLARNQRMQHMATAIKVTGGKVNPDWDLAVGHSFDDRYDEEDF